MSTVNPEPKPVNPEPTNSVDDDYTPTFSKRFRTVVYVVGVIWSAVALVLVVLSTDLSWPKWAADLIATLGPIMPGIAAAFGVHYAGVSK